MADVFPVVIHHNPDCGTSRNTLAMIEAAGYAPTVIEYLKVGWTKPQLQGLLAVMGATPRDILREKGTPAGDLGLLGEGVEDDVILAAMVTHPVLVNRPIVATPKGVGLCRPSEAVLGLLERSPPASRKRTARSFTRRRLTTRSGRSDHPLSARRRSFVLVVAWFPLQAFAC